MELGESVRERRHELGLTQQDVARLARISRNHLVALEQGANVSIDVVKKVARALGMSRLPLGEVDVSVSGIETAVDSVRINQMIGQLGDALGDAIQRWKSLAIYVEGENEKAHPGAVLYPRLDPIGMQILDDLLAEPDSPLRPVKLELEEEIDVPIMGYVAAGLPIDSLNQDHGETIRIPFSEAPDPKWVALQARGDSMIEFGIYDGDLVYVEPRRGGVAATGEIVIGWLNEGLVIKKWSRKGGVRKLISENREYPDRILTAEDTWELQAIVRKHVPRRIRGRLFPSKEMPKISG